MKSTLLNIVLALAVVVLSARLVYVQHHLPAGTTSAHSPNTAQHAAQKTTQSTTQNTTPGTAQNTAQHTTQNTTHPLLAQFEEFDVTHNFPNNPFTYFKGKGLLLAVGDSTDYNEMTIGWGALGNIWERGMSLMTVFVAEKRYTHHYMDSAHYFTVMEFDDADKDILAYMGSHSGRDGNKAAALGLHTLYTDHGTPYFAEARIVYECEMIYHAPFDPAGFGDIPATFYSTAQAGIHSMYMGKIVRSFRRQ